MKKKLESLGLSRNEASVYLTLMKLKSATAGAITKRSGVHRRNVYDALERLEKRGLVCHDIRDRYKHFSPTNPHNLLQCIEDEKLKIIHKELVAKEIAGALENAYCSHHELRTNVTIRKGVKGIRTVLEDILATGKENRVLGAHKPPEVISSYISNFHKRRVKAGIQTRLMFSNDYLRSRKIANLPHTEVRRMPKQQNRTTSINIYGDKVAILSWSDPVSILIEDRKIAEFYRYLFDALWDTLK